MRQDVHHAATQASQLHRRAKADAVRLVREPGSVGQVAKDLDLKILNDPETLAEGKLPKTWWLSYPRAVAVGLGVDLDVGAVPPKLDALVVLGIGETDTAELVDAHNATGRMAVLAPGTPTNTVAGEPTTDLGGTAETIFPLVHAEAATQVGKG